MNQDVKRFDEFINKEIREKYLRHDVDENNSRGSLDTSEDSLLLSPILADYVGRVKSGTTTFGNIPSSNPEIQTSNLVDAQPPTIIGNSSADEFWKNIEDTRHSSSQFRQESLSALCQLDTSYCPSLGLGSSSSGDISDVQSDKLSGDRFSGMSIGSDMDQNLIPEKHIISSSVISSQRECATKASENSLRAMPLPVGVTQMPHISEEKVETIKSQHSTETISQDEVTTIHREISFGSDCIEDESSIDNLKDEGNEYLSPFKTGSAKWRGLVQKITPLASGESLGLNLTPVFKSLRSRLSKNPAMDDNLADTCEEIQNSDLVHEKESIQYEQSQVTPSKTRHEVSDISLTPALRALRSKLLATSDKVDNSKRGHLKGMMSSKNMNEVNERQKFVKSTRMKSDLNSSSTSSSSDLNLTPALEALKSKLHVEGVFLSPNLIHLENEISCKFEKSPIGMSKLESKIDLSDGLQLESNMSTTGEKSERKSIKFEDDSYTSQPRDLASARKRLNARSSAFAERLRGAAQRRTINLTKSRDSLVAKESTNSNSTHTHFPRACRLPTSVIPNRDRNEGKIGVPCQNIPQKIRSRSLPRSRMSPELAGLDIIKKTSSYCGGKENVPFTLHSSIRAKQRVKFEKYRLVKEKERQIDRNRERKQVVNKLSLELQHLKCSLR